jgi:hypothetical protein
VRQLSNIGAVLVAVFALTAIGASAAQATESTFGWASGTTKIERSANTAQIFKVTNNIGTLLAEVKCNTVIANATVSGTGAASVTTNAGTLTYNNSGSIDTCPSNIGTAEVKTNNCEYQFTPGLSTGTGTSTGTVDIVNCPPTAPIEMTVIVNTVKLCQVKISNQTGIGPVTYTTTATAPSTITAVVNAVNSIVVTGSGIACSSAATTDYEGDVTFEGTTSAGAQSAIKVLP